MSKRSSGPPRRPRNPVAKAVRTPAFRIRVVPEQRWKEQMREVKAEEGEAADDEELKESTDDTKRPK